MDKNKFFVCAYLAPPPPMKENSFDESLRKRGYELLKCGGFTHVIGFYEKVGQDDEEVCRSVAEARKNQIGYIAVNAFSGKRFDEDKFESSVKGFCGKGCGMVLFDEPAVKQFPVLKRETEIYRKYAKNGDFAYVNLPAADNPPYYLQNGMWTAHDDSADLNFGRYFDLYAETFAPEYLSYDFYPLYDDAVVKSGYLEQLAFVAEKSETLGVPFYPYVQSCSWQKGVRIPESAEVLWQCFLSLAFGAGGVQYFCFFTPYSNGENRRDVAMLDFSADPTPRYFAAAAFNLFLKSIEKDYFSFSRKSTVFVAENFDSSNDCLCAGFAREKGIYRDCFDEKGVKIFADGAFCGLFETKRECSTEGGKNFAIVVSNGSFYKEKELLIKNYTEFGCIVCGIYGKTKVYEKEFSIKLGKGCGVFLLFGNRPRGKQ